MAVLRWLVILGLFCAGMAAHAEPRDTVRIAVLAPQGIGTLDPHFATAHYARMLDSWIYGALVRFRPGSISPSQIEPDLAESWEVSADRLTWTFHLRSGVAFHHGFGPVTADDVVFSLGRAANARTSATATDFADIDAIEAVDPSTVRIVLRRAMPSLLGLLANYAGGFIASHQAFLRADGDQQKAAIGFGPFMLDSQVPGQSMHLTANYGYFRGRPKLRGIDYKFVSALSTSDLAFNAGEVDIIEGQQSQTWIDRTRALPNARVDVIEPAEISWLHLNVTQKPLNDLRVRQAIALAVNRPELAAWRGADLAHEARGVIPVRYLGFAADLRLPATDIAQSRRLLAEAGYPDGLTLETIHTSNPVMLNAIQVVQAQLLRAGITLDVRVVDHPTYNQMIRQDLSPVVHYAAARFPVAETMLMQFFHSRSSVGTQGAVTNFSHCAAADAALDAASGERDLERQLELWADAQRAIIAATCVVPLLETLQVWARRKDFDYGFDFDGAMSTGPLLTENARFLP